MKYKIKYLEIQNKINNYNQSGGINLKNNNDNINNSIIKFISPHHRFLIENLDILHNPQQREKFLITSYIQNEINKLVS
jgi:hypothetical protein